MKNRKGLSNVIATVLIILLALAAVVIIWTFIRSSIVRGGETTDITSRCLQAEVQPVSCSISTSTDEGTVVLRLNRGDVDGMKAVITDVGTGATAVSDSQATSEVLGTLTFGPYSTSGLAGPDYTASGAAVIEDASGRDVVCDISPIVINCVVV